MQNKHRGSVDIRSAITPITNLSKHKNSVESATFDNRGSVDIFSLANSSRYTKIVTETTS